MLTVQFDTPEAEATFQRLAGPDGGVALAQQVARQKLHDYYAEHFPAFCRDVLGYAEMNPHHDALCRYLQDDPALVKLVLMPRYSFKSYIGTIGYALWTLWRDPNQRILIYSDAAEKAEGFLLGIKNHILGLIMGSDFRALTQPTWEVDPQQQTWNQSAIVIKPRTEASEMPSVDTAGLDTSKVGKHYDIIIFDDLVTDKNVTTKELMDKVNECYRKSKSLLKPGGLTLLLGTRWHEGELYGRLLAEASPGLSVFLRDAEVAPDGTPYPFADIGLTASFLTRQKAEQGTRIYSCLYRLNPQDDETRTFKAKDFAFYQADRQTETFKQWVSQLYITCVLDAIPPPTSDHGDDAAITVVGTDAEHTLYLLDAVAGRLSPDQQIEEVLSLHAAWRFRKFGLETNAFQRMLWSTLEQRLKALRTDPRWTPFSIVEFSGLTQGNKEQRIQGLQPWHERGLLKLPGTKLELLSGVWSQLAYQMLQFPHSQKDDLVDSLAYHLQLKQAGSVTVPIQAIPYGSAAWAAQEERTEELLVMQRRPRWQRRPVPELVFS